MVKPHYVERLHKLGRFLPLGPTQRGEIIKKGHLKTVPLTLDGRARGVTHEEIMRYQREIMGLEPLGDDAPETAPRTVGDTTSAPATPEPPNRQAPAPRVARKSGGAR